MQLITTAKALDLNTWIRGLLSSGISSFGGAIASGFGPAVVDPKDFNFEHPGKMVETAIIGATIAAVISIGKFLNSSPLPDLKEVERTTQTITPGTGDGSPKVIETVKETHVEPIKPPVVADK